MGLVVAFRWRTVTRAAAAIVFILTLRALFSSSAPSHEITHSSYVERLAKGKLRSLDVQSLPFLQSRIGRDERSDILDEYIDAGMDEFWSQYQLPFLRSPETAHIDAQAVRSAIEDLLSLHGWVAKDCLTLNRPFGQNTNQDAYDDLAENNQLYYVAMVVHSADHFLVDQLATVVQLARKLGTQNLFVSMLDYDSSDSTETLTDLSEAVLTLLGIPFRIRRISTLTEVEEAGYYPLEEAYTRNLALEPLLELKKKRDVSFDKVIWLKGFTCPNDVLETIKVTQVNNAAMTCGMDWAENNKFFVFSDRWRTRDMDGDQFRVSRSTSASAPPREEISARRYAQHLPFQVFCCESGTHVVDPAQTYYRGLKYRYSSNFYNTSRDEADGTSPPTEWDKYGECMDSTQAWFCRDIWVESAMAGLKYVDQPALPPPKDEKKKAKAKHKRSLFGRQDQGAEDEPPRVQVPGPKVDGQPKPKPEPEAPPPAIPPPVVDIDDGAPHPLVPVRPAAPDHEDHEGPVKLPPAPIGGGLAGARPAIDDSPIVPPPPGGIPGVPQADANRDAPKNKPESDADRGSDFDTVPEKSPPPLAQAETTFKVPNGAFESARILINPRCVTTYAGVSHTKLANDLFGKDLEKNEEAREYDKRTTLYGWPQVSEEPTLVAILN